MLGIDVSMDTLDCTLLDSATRRALWTRQFKNTEKDIKRLLKAVPPEHIWALEPTGRYGTPLVKMARTAGRDVRLADTRRAKSFLRSVQGRAKCDRLDGKGLGLFALSRELPSYPVKSDEVEHVAQLMKARRGIAQSLQQLEAQAKALPRASESLQPAIDALKLQERNIKLEVAALLKAATEPVATEPVTTGVSSEATKYLVASLACAPKLMKIPGVGQVTAATIAAALAGRSFSHSDSFVAYCGLDVEVRQSGRKKGNLGLTKQGDAELRRLLYLAAQANLKSKDSPFKAHYERERAKGLPTTAALCSVARKIARICWSLAYHYTEYDSDRVYQNHKNPKNA